MLFCNDLSLFPKSRLKWLHKYATEIKGSLRNSPKPKADGKEGYYEEDNRNGG